MLSGDKTTHRYCMVNSKKYTPVAASRHHHYICQLVSIATTLALETIHYRHFKSFLNIFLFTRALPACNVQETWFLLIQHGTDLK